MASTQVSVIIPAYNEGQSIGSLVNTIRALYPDFEIIVINDGSTDQTAEAAREAGAIVYGHPYNIGNGSAIKSGIRFASGDILVFMDADGQHDPEDIGRMIAFFPEYDMVVGARPLKFESSWVRSLANRLYNRFASYVAKFQIKDLTSGFRAAKSEVVRNMLYLLPNTYSYPTTLTLSILRAGRSLKYMPIKVQRRQGGKSQIRMLRDGVRFFMIIVKICTLYSPFRIFLPVSFVIFLTGLGHYLYTYWTTSRFTNMSALLIMTSVIIFMMGLISEQISQMRFERSEGDRFV